MSLPARPRVIALLAVWSCFCFSAVLCAQTPDSTGDANKSWTDTRESQGGDANPTRTVESHSQSGNRTQDNQSIQRRGLDGRFEPYQDTEKTTVQVDASTTRTTTRTFGRDADGRKTLVQVTEEERRTRPGGNSSVVRSTSNPDADGRLQLTQRETAETKKISKDVSETKTTVMLPSVNGGLAPAMMTEERSTQGANDTVQSKKTTLMPDVNGKFQVSEVKESTTRKDGGNQTSEERVSRLDGEGKLGEVSRTVSRDSTSAGEKRSTVETYSADVPGAARDGNLHVVERATTVQSTSSNGRQDTRHQVERPDPGNPDAGLQVTVVTSESVRPGASGAQTTQTIQMRDANGSMAVVSVDTTKSDNNHAVQVQIAPAVKPK